MSDFSDLWNSVTPNSTKKSIGNESIASQLQTGRGNIPGATSQPISRVSTPSYLSAQGISPQLSGQAQRTSPRPGAASSASSATTNPGDAFRDLFALSNPSQSKNMTIAERQALASREQAKAEEQARREREANGAFWDKFEFSNSGSTKTSGSKSAGLLSVSPPLVPRIETTILTPSRAAPLPSSRPSTSAATPASHADIWDLDSFLAPNKSISQTPPPSSIVSPGPRGGHTNANLFDLLDASLPANHLSSNVSSGETAVRSETPGDFDWGNREDNFDDDLLGDLGKPVSREPSKPTTPIPPNEPHLAERRQPAPVTRRGSPPPHILGQIVEMGFSVQEAKRALASTDTGSDVQAALDSLLGAGAPSGGHDRGPSADDLERFREEDEAARREYEEGEQQRRNRTGPSRSPAPEATVDETARQLQERADQLLAQASIFGTNMFNRANALWKEGKDKAMKAYEERTAGQASVNPVRFNGDNRPAWMQDEQPPPRERHEREIPGRSRFRDDGDDDSPVLPTRPAPQPSRPAAVRHSSRPTVSTTAPERPADKIASLFSDVPAYISPARRKAASQTPTPVQPSPAIERSAPTPVVLRTRPNPSVSPDILSAVQAHRNKGTEAFKLGQYAAAIESYTAALELLPENHLTRIPLLNNRAAARSKIGETSGSIEDCTLVLSELGNDFDPTKETPIPDLDLSAAFIKALRRRAETFESTEKWKRAREDWERLSRIGGTWAGSKASSDGVQGVGRCKRMEEGGGAPVSRPRIPVTSSRPKPKPKPMSTKTPTRPEDSAVHRLKIANAEAEAEGDQKHALKDTVDARIMSWKGGKENNIRALIASLETVLWPELGWTKVGMHELVMPNQVKIKYVRAIAKVHPDKLNVNSTSVEQRMIANAVFGALNEAWNSFEQ